MEFDWIVPLLEGFIKRQGAASAKVVSAEPAARAYDNNCSELTRIKLRLLAENGTPEWTVSVIAKVNTPAIIEAKPILKKMALGRTEITAYRDALEPMKKILTDYGFEITWPEFYGYREYDTIIIEDLKATGFETRDRFRGFDAVEMFFVVSELAKFHGICAVAQERGLIHPHKFPSHPFFENEESIVAYMSSCFKHVLQYTAPKWPESAQQRYLGVLERLPSIYYDEVTKLRERPGFKVLNQGDYWLTNILIKYDEETGKPSKLKMVDYQMCNYGSFAMDLHYIISMSIQSEIDRHDVIESLISEYHKTLKTTLETCEYSKEPPTLEEIRSEMEATLFMRIVYTCVFLPISKQKPLIQSDAECSPMPLENFYQMRKRRFSDDDICRLLLRKFDYLWERGLFKSL